MPKIYVHLMVLCILIPLKIFANITPDIACNLDEKKQYSRSMEIKRLYEADQKDRENWFDLTDDEKIQVNQRDLNRRMRIGEIFGEGCFKTSDDFENAAMIFQHGDIPDHYFLAFVWANRAVQLGKNSAKKLVAMAIDRYLVEIHHKQLFASQAYSSSQTNGCLCLQAYEDSFPDRKRLEFTQKSLIDQINWVKNFNGDKDCPNIICPFPLEASPVNTVPGFW